MKLIGMREAREKFAEFVEQAQGERIVVTRHGRPALLLVGIEGEDLEKVLADERWQRLKAQRAEGEGDAVSLDAAARTLGLVKRGDGWAPKETTPRRKVGRAAAALKKKAARGKVAR